MFGSVKTRGIVVGKISELNAGNAKPARGPFLSVTQHQPAPQLSLLERFDDYEYLPDPVCATFSESANHMALDFQNALIVVKRSQSDSLKDSTTVLHIFCPSKLGT